MYIYAFYDLTMLQFENLDPYTVQNMWHEKPHFFK